MSEGEKNESEGQGGSDSNLWGSPFEPPKEPWKPYQLAFLLTAGTVFLLWVFRYRLLMSEISVVSLLYYPIYFITQGAGDSLLPKLAKLVLFLGILFGFYLVMIRAWRGSSPGLKRALGLCALAGVSGFWGLKVYSARVDWTSRGLNPDVPGFKPAVVLLAGTFDYRFTGIDTGRHYAGTARFEIRMRGADYYYAEGWKGKSDRQGSWDALTLSMPDFSGTWNRSQTITGGHGRGGSSEHCNDGLLVARRLWQGQEFIGATAADEYSLKSATERFFDLKPYGRFQIPGRIEWQEGDRYEVLHIRRVEFLNAPSTNWFGAIREKYFEHGENQRELWKSNLPEAGWAGEEKP